MAIQLTIKNYRCFVSPITIDLSKGFKAFVGVNNAGKSAAMRFLLEMRPMLQMVGQPQAMHQSLVHPNLPTFLLMSLS
jgi:predicted ATPase